MHTHGINSNYLLLLLPRLHSRVCSQGNDSLQYDLVLSHKKFEANDSRSLRIRKGNDFGTSYQRYQREKTGRPWAIGLARYLQT